MAKEYCGSCLQALDKNGNCLTRHCGKHQQQGPKVPRGLGKLGESPEKGRQRGAGWLAAVDAKRPEKLRREAQKAFGKTVKEISVNRKTGELESPEAPEGTMIIKKQGFFSDKYVIAPDPNSEIWKSWKGKKR